MGISSAGIGSGLDVNGLVSQLLALERQPLNSLTSKKQTFNDQLSAFGRVKSDLDAFKTAISGLKVDLDFSAAKATSSNSDLLTATASSTSSAGTYDVTVKTLAQASTQATNAFWNSSSAALGKSGTLTLNTSKKSISVDVVSTDSLDAIKEKINSAIADGDASTQTFAKASVINSGTSANPRYQFVVNSGDKGTDNRVTVTDDNGIFSGTALDSNGQPIPASGFKTTQAAADAVMTINGLEITRSSNTISDAIDGVTLNLASADPAKPLTLTVARDTDALTKKVNDFISAYNKLSSTVNSLHQKGGTLEADNSATSVLYQLQAVFNQPAKIPGSDLSYLAQVGISFKKDGSLSLDSDIFTKALTNNPTKTIALFTDSDQGFSQRLYTAASNMLNDDGLVDSRIKGLNKRIKTIDTNIDQQNVRLDNIETRLRKQYASLDSLLGTMKNTSSYLAAQLR